MGMHSDAMASLKMHIAEDKHFADRPILKGTEGATSVKAEITNRIPILRTAAGYREARRIIRQELGGRAIVREELARAGFVDRSTNLLNTNGRPGNIFAQLAVGQAEQEGFVEE